MIDNFLGIDTDVGGGGRGVWVVILFFLKDRSSLQYFVTQWMGQSSMFLPFTLYVILGGGLWLWVGWEEGKEESQGGSIAVYKGAVAHGVSRNIKFSQIFCVCFIVFLYMSAGCVSTIRT